mmetsp:Transcript_11718/g.19086  ORF Transcript_11718/g.19086 Transcript_11718/m.19086 type:complete len:80 (+) Transcript_11718:610-849(+)
MEKNFCDSSGSQLNTDCPNELANQIKLKGNRVRATLFVNSWDLQQSAERQQPVALTDESRPSNSVKFSTVKELGSAFSL